jgi:hypothetical protein
MRCIRAEWKTQDLAIYGSTAYEMQEQNKHIMVLKRRLLRIPTWNGDFSST